MEDVEGIKDKVDIEIAKLRAHDSETSGNLISMCSLNVCNKLLVLNFQHKYCEMPVQLQKQPYYSEISAAKSHFNFLTK